MGLQTTSPLHHWALVFVPGLRATGPSEQWSLAFGPVGHQISGRCPFDWAFGLPSLWTTTPIPPHQYFGLGLREPGAGLRNSGLRNYHACCALDRLRVGLRIALAAGEAQSIFSWRSRPLAGEAHPVGLRMEAQTSMGDASLPSSRCGEVPAEIRLAKGRGPNTPSHQIFLC